MTMVTAGDEELDLELDLAGAVCVVTGATRGIGRAAALALGRSGAHVVVVGRSTHERPDSFAPGTLEEVVAQLGAEGIPALAVQADLTDPGGADVVVERTLDWRGRCDVLVNNAAYTSNGPILEVPPRRWQTGFQMQVTTPLQLCQAFVPGMLERGQGRVLNVGTRAARELIENLPLYGTTKTAQEQMTRWLDFELGGRGVSFNVFRIESVVTTEGWHVVLEHQGEDIATGSHTSTELVTPEECATIIEWMVRRPSSWSGQVLEIAEARELRADA
jgi:NAD(P)-dependent dehydrogenase (short-subunit alcohol dehydrogenase family)